MVFVVSDSEHFVDHFLGPCLLGFAFLLLLEDQFADFSVDIESALQDLVVVFRLLDVVVLVVHLHLMELLQKLLSVQRRVSNASQVRYQDHAVRAQRFTFQFLYLFAFASFVGTVVDFVGSPSFRVVALLAQFMGLRANSAFDQLDSSVHVDQPIKLDFDGLRVLVDDLFG